MSAKAVSRLKRSISHSNLEMSELQDLRKHLMVRGRDIMWERLKKARRTKQALYIHNMEFSKERAVVRPMIGKAIRIRHMHPRKFKGESGPECRRITLDASFGPSTISIGFCADLDLRFEPCPEGLAYLLTKKDDE